MAQRLDLVNRNNEDMERKEAIKEENQADKFRVQSVLAGFARLGKKKNLIQNVFLAEQQILTE